MIVDKNTLIEAAEWELNCAKKIVKENSELFEECKKYYALWENKERESHLHISRNYVGVNLNLFMTEQHSMKDVELFLDNIPYEFMEVSEYVEGKRIRYVYKKGNARLHIIFNYYDSKH